MGGGVDRAQNPSPKVALLYLTVILHNLLNTVMQKYWHDAQIIATLAYAHHKHVDNLTRPVHVAHQVQ